MSSSSEMSPPHYHAIDWTNWFSNNTLLAHQAVWGGILVNFRLSSEIRVTPMKSFGDNVTSVIDWSETRHIISQKSFYFLFITIVNEASGSSLSHTLVRTARPLPSHMNEFYQFDH